MIRIHFFVFFVSLEKNSSAQIISAYFLSALLPNFVSFQGKNKWIAPLCTFYVGCMFINRFVEFLFFSLWKLISKFIGKFFVFQKLIVTIEKGYQLKNRLVPCVIIYSPRVSFYLTPLFFARKKSLRENSTHVLIFFIFSKNTALKFKVPKSSLHERLRPNFWHIK